MKPVRLKPPGAWHRPLLLLIASALAIVLWGGTCPQIPKIEPQLLNPHRNHAFSYKGQVHVHSIESDGCCSPVQVQDHYRILGYRFLALTDHFVSREESPSNPFSGCTWPSIPGLLRGRCTTCAQIVQHLSYPRPEILYVPAMESCDLADNHLLGLGLTRQDPDCGPRCVFLGNQDRIDHFLGQGAVAVLGHPTDSSHPWSRNEVLEDLTCFHGLEINDPGDVDLWDQLLTRGKRVWGFATDDCHGLDEKCNEGWIVVNSSLGPPEAILPSPQPEPTCDELYEECLSDVCPDGSDQCDTSGCDSLLEDCLGGFERNRRDRRPQVPKPREEPQSARVESPDVVLRDTVTRDDETPTREQLRTDLIANIASGNFLAVRHFRASGGSDPHSFGMNGPEVKIQILGGLINVSLDHPGTIIFKGARGQVLYQTSRRELAANYTIKGSETYVRVEVVQDRGWARYRAYSQPLFVVGRVHPAWCPS